MPRPLSSVEDDALPIGMIPHTKASINFAVVAIRPLMSEIESSLKWLLADQIRARK